MTTSEQRPAWVDEWLGTELELTGEQIAFIRSCALDNLGLCTRFPWASVVRCGCDAPDCERRHFVVSGYCLAGAESREHLIVTTPETGRRCAVVDAAEFELVGYRGFLVPELVEEIARAIGDA